MLIIWALWGWQKPRDLLSNREHLLCRNPHLSCQRAAEHELRWCLVSSALRMCLEGCHPLQPPVLQAGAATTLSQPGGAAGWSCQTLHRSKLGRALISLLPSTSHPSPSTGRLWAALISNSPSPPDLSYLYICLLLQPRLSHAQARPRKPHLCSNFWRWQWSLATIHLLKHRQLCTCSLSISGIIWCSSPLPPLSCSLAAYWPHTY